LGPWTRVVVTETRRVTFFNLDTDERLFDVSLRFNASSGTVTFGDTKEGGLVAVRVASMWSGRLPNPLELLAPRVQDDEAQVRLEAVRALAA